MLQAAEQHAEEDGATSRLRAVLRRRGRRPRLRQCRAGATSAGRGRAGSTSLLDRDEARSLPPCRRRQCFSDLLERQVEGVLERERSCGLPPARRRASGAREARMERACWRNVDDPRKDTEARTFPNVGATSRPDGRGPFGHLAPRLRGLSGTEVLAMRGTGEYRQLRVRDGCLRLAAAGRGVGASGGARVREEIRKREKRAAARTREDARGGAERTASGRRSASLLLPPG